MCSIENNILAENGIENWYLCFQGVKSLKIDGQLWSAGNNNIFCAKGKRKESIPEKKESKVIHSQSWLTVISFKVWPNTKL